MSTVACLCVDLLKQHNINITVAAAAAADDDDDDNDNGNGDAGDTDEVVFLLSTLCQLYLDTDGGKHFVLLSLSC